VCAAAFSPDGTHLAVGTFLSMSNKLDAPGTASVWDARTGRMVRTFPSDNCGVWRLAWSPDGRRLAVASGVHFISRGTAKVWDVATGELVHHLRGHAEPVWGVSFSPDGRRLATASGNRTARAPQANGEVKIWDMDTGLELLGLPEDRASAFDVAFSPCGRWLGAGYADGKLRVWELRPGALAVAPAPRPVERQAQPIGGRP
jgi:WD40 repeat protein